MCQGFSHLSGILHHFVLTKLATSSIWVRTMHDPPEFDANAVKSWPFFKHSLPSFRCSTIESSTLSCFHCQFCPPHTLSHKNKSLNQRIFHAKITFYQMAPNWRGTFLTAVFCQPCLKNCCDLLRESSGNSLLQRLEILGKPQKRQMWIGMYTCTCLIAMDTTVRAQK